MSTVPSRISLSYPSLQPFGTRPGAPFGAPATATASPFQKATLPQDPFAAAKTDDFVPSFYPSDPEAQLQMMMRLESTKIPEAYSAHEASLKQPVEFVGGRNPDATVLVIDSFGSSDGSQSHGETVVDVMKRAGLEERDIQRVEHPKPPAEALDLMGVGLESPASRLDSHIELVALDMLSSTQSTIEKALDTPDNQIKTITHSIATQAFDIGSLLSKAAVKFDEATGEPELSFHGAHICEAFGVEPQATPENLRKLTERAIGRAHDVISNSPRVKEQRQSFDNQLAELKAQGISYYHSAGNSEDDLELFRGIFPVESASTHSLLSVPNANLVGALDTKGTPDPSDDEIADFSTLDPNVRYLANGVNIPAGEEFVNGTSFSAPYVAAKSELARRDGLELHQLPEAHNNWSGPLAIL